MSGDFVIVRVFDAPRALVWKAWTDPEHFMRWWGPENFTSPSCTMDLRVGGKYLWCMRSAAGKEYWNTGVYREIVPLERIVYTDGFADAQGNPVPPSYYGMPDAPASAEFVVTVTFTEQNGKTTMTLRHAMPPEWAAGAKSGWNGSFDKLAASLR
jgi:uncharacterized protein YndB with AHSA1/START domain